MLVVGFAVAFSVLAPRTASAQDAFSCIEELSDDEVKYRIRKIEGTLRDGKTHAAAWRYTWMSIFLGLGAGATYLAVDGAQKGNQWDKFGWAYLASGFYFSGVIHAALPAADVWGAKRIGRKDASTEEARRAKLQYATETLQKSNDTQALLSGPLGVVGATVFGVVGGSVKATQWTGRTKGLTAGLFVAPPVLAMLAVATAPRESVTAWEGYRGIACSSKYYDTHEEGPDLDFSMNPGGGSFTLRF